MMKQGFTLVEIMITVAIIGMLAAMAIPSFIMARHTSHKNIFLNDLRVAREAFEQYNLETKGSYPAEAGQGIVPPEMSAYLSKMNWADETSIGGHWDWDRNEEWCKAGIAVNGPSWSDDYMLDIDRDIDDGNLNTGMFRKYTGGYVYILDE